MVTSANKSKSALFSISMHWKRRQIPFGELYHSSIETSLSFNGTATLLYLISDICNRNDYPPLYAPLRSMLKESARRRLLRVSPRKRYDYSADFTITIIQRKNYTMRGFIELNEKMFLFRSAMELEGYLLDMMACIETPALMTAERRIPPERKMR